MSEPFPTPSQAEGEDTQATDGDNAPYTPTR